MLARPATAISLTFTVRKLSEKAAINMVFTVPTADPSTDVSTLAK